MKRFIGVAACLVFVWVALVGADAVQAATTGKTSSKQQASKVVSLSGTVQKSADGLVLKTAKGSYEIAGQDLSLYAGKKVTVSGTVSPPASKGGRKIVHVTKVK